MIITLCLCMETHTHIYKPFVREYQTCNMAAVFKIFQRQGSVFWDLVENVLDFHVKKEI